jgi:hypothetical protein
MILDPRVYATAIVVGAAFYASAPMMGWLHRWFDIAMKSAGVIISAACFFGFLDWLWS